MLITLSSSAQNNTSFATDHITPDEYKNYSVATFAAGSFWHEEALFESIIGVKEAVSGYAGGTTDDPTYESVETCTTGYAETVMVYYDPNLVSYATLVEVFFAGQNPTQVNGQGPDHGTQYRSIAFFRTPFEKQVIDNQIRAINLSGKNKARVATQVIQFTKFWVAEDYHQDYIEKEYKQISCRLHTCYFYSCNKKNFQEQYPQLIKPDHVF